MPRYANVPSGRKTHGKPKIFVLDTNIILHDYKAIRKFQDNNIVIPIAVIEELDKFKKGSDALAFNARGFVREIDRLTEGKMFGKDGVPIGKGLGKIKIEPNHPFAEEFKDFFMDDIPDHRILSVGYNGTPSGLDDEEFPWETTDDPLTDKHNYVIHAEANAILNFRGSLKELTDAWNGSDKDVVCARYDSSRKRIVLVRAREAYGIRPRNDEQKFALDACLDPKIQLVSLTGGAGTGKTLLALASALEQERDFDQIILSRPTVILGNQDIGFLPGDQKTKMSPYLQPLMDNLNVIKAQFRPSSKEALKIEGLLKDEKLVISPLAYIRGRSLGKAFFIIDEAQNLTPHEIKTIITRAGEGTKMVFTGDIFQIDQPYLDQWSNGLTHLGEKMTGQKLFQHVFLRKGERSELSEIAAKLL